MALGASEALAEQGVPESKDIRHVKLLVARTALSFVPLMTDAARQRKQRVFE